MVKANKEVSELKKYPPCPFYEPPKGMPNATCRFTATGVWISASNDTRYYCQWNYIECLRYMKAKGIKDKEYEQLNKEYFGELLGIEPERKFSIKKIKLRGGNRNNGKRQFKIGRVTTLARSGLYEANRPRKIHRD